jgi:hypothetical protein
MNGIFKYLQENDYLVKSSTIVKDIDGCITHIYATKKDLSFCIIAPHECDEYEYVLRVNPIITFDRWSTCDFEKSFATDKRFIAFLSEHMIDIYSAILSVYIESYMRKESEDDDYEW